MKGKKRMEAAIKGEYDEAVERGGKLVKGTVFTRYEYIILTRTSHCALSSA
jgi:hypothetical protein